MNYSVIPSPCYVLDEQAFRNNLEVLNRVQQEAGVTILCALKGFAFYHAFPLMKQYIQGATASSLNEVLLCNNELHTPAHLCAPAYRDDEFDELLSGCSHITFNTLTQYERFRDKTAASDVLCGIRINPQYSEIETDMYNPCVPGSRLGITAEVLGGHLPDGITGLHFHTLCENDSHTLERTLEHVERRFGPLLDKVQWVNMGGGHHITRADYDVNHLIKTLIAFQDKYDVDVILEPGEAFGWKTGVLRASVLDIMDSQGISVAVLDTSIAAHMPDCLEMPYKPRVIGATDVQAGKPTYRLGGTTCLAGDYIGDYSFEKPLNIGDDIIFDDMIHYTMVKTLTFNGVKLPSIGTWKEDGTFVLHREFGYESYKDRLG